MVEIEQVDLRRRKTYIVATVAFAAAVIVEVLQGDTDWFIIVAVLLTVGSAYLWGRADSEDRRKTMEPTLKSKPHLR
jgi:predicted cobalt transporter CbtA